MSLPSISIRTPVSTGSMSSRPAAVTAWATAWENTSLLTMPVASGMSGRAGYSSTGIVWRVNVAEPQVQRHLGAVDRHVDRLVGQAAADVGEQPAGHQGAALVLARRRDGHPGRGLVVEGGEHQAVASLVGLDEQAGQDRDARAHRAGCAPPRRRRRSRTSRSTRNFTARASCETDRSAVGTAGRDRNLYVRELHPATRPGTNRERGTTMRGSSGPVLPRSRPEEKFSGIDQMVIRSSSVGTVETGDNRRPRRSAAEFEAAGPVHSTGQTPRACARE